PRSEARGRQRVRPAGSRRFGVPHMGARVPRGAPADRGGGDGVTSDDADPPSPAGTDPRDLREPWVRPETGALTPAAMMAYIRARCPWARAHTHRSLAPYLLEETVELMAAIVEDEAANTEDSGARGTGAANAAGAAGAADAAEVADAAGAADAAEVADAAGAADAVEAELADVLYQVLFHAA